MKNVSAKVEGNFLILRVDLTAKGEASKSGLSNVIATTNGNQEVQPGVFLGLNVYQKKSVDTMTPEEALAFLKHKAKQKAERQALKAVKA